MNFWDWYRLPVEERQRIAGPQESIKDLMGFMVQNMHELGELSRKLTTKGAGE